MIKSLCQFFIPCFTGLYKFIYSKNNFLRGKIKVRFWYYWFIGIAIIIITRIGINRLSYYSERNCDKFEWRSKNVEELMHIPVIICISLVEWLTVAIFLGTCGSIGDYIFRMVFAGGIIYVFVWAILGLHHFQRISSQICFVVVFIISVLFGTIPINNYNKNIEKTTEIVTTSTEERELLYFHDIPVQNVSGHIEGSSNLFVGSVSGNVKTTDEIPYWYIDKEGNGKYDKAPATSSTLNIASENDSPYVKITSYSKQEKTTDHNTGKEDIEVLTTWKEYIFYLPEEVMQYPIN